MRALFLAASVAAAVAAASPGQSTKSSAASATSTNSVLRVTANDYAFTVSSPPRAGLVTVRLVNHGREMHHLELSPVKDDLTLHRFYELATADQPSPLVVDAGGPNMTAPGDSSEVSVELAPGRYILTCWVNGTDGKPHVMRGMMAEVRLGQGRADAPPPPATVAIRASDYAFAIHGTLRRGANVVAFENAGPQEHDIQFVRLKPGESAAGIADWAKKGGIGSPTAAVVGGASGIDRGRRIWFTLALQPGR